MKVANPTASNIAAMGRDSAYERHSVTLPRETSQAVRERVGSRGFSAYVAAAVERQLRKDARREMLADMEAKYGPVDEGEVAAIMKRMGWA